jgi:hypothetical protein
MLAAATKPATTFVSAVGVRACDLMQIAWARARNGAADVCFRPVPHPARTRALTTTIGHLRESTTAAFTTGLAKDKAWYEFLSSKA